MVPMQTLVAVGVVVLSALALLLKGRRRTLRGFRLPPGPVPLPLVGNFFSIDAKKPWATYAEWAARYGDIFMIRVFKQDIIVVNSKKIAKDLLDHRSRIYSDRPCIATRDPFGWDFNFAWSQYGDQWRSQRRMFQQAFRAEASLEFHPAQLRKARQLVLDILSEPRDFFKHIQRFSVAVVLSVVYDYELAPHHDRLVELFDRGAALAMEGLTPEAASIVEAFPFILNLPDWFPGSFFKRKAEVSKYCATQMIEEPFEYAKTREVMGGGSSATALDHMMGTQDIDDPLQLRLLKNTCATAFAAGAETTSSTLQFFMLSMLQYPDVQQRAQAEIDVVVGTNRLPNFDDRPNLPYVEAILMETLRMYPVAPLGVPHGTTADDIYENIFIPKGSSVVTNIWAMHHNEDDYPEPEVFKPERFFVDGKFNGDKSVDSLAFGFGRRVCPGRYAADGSIWVAMVSILYAFKITKALDEQGNVVDFEPTASAGVTTHLHPFPCAITPRLTSMDIHKLSTEDS